MQKDKDLLKAIKLAGGVAALARALGISSQAVSQWVKIPPKWADDIAQLTGQNRHQVSGLAKLSEDEKKALGLS